MDDECREGTKLCPKTLAQPRFFGVSLRQNNDQPPNLEKHLKKTSWPTTGTQFPMSFRSGSTGCSHGLTLRLLRCFCFSHRSIESFLRWVAANIQRVLNSNTVFFGDTSMTGWWWLEHESYFFNIFWGSSSKLTNSYFSEGWVNHQPVHFHEI